MTLPLINNLKDYYFNPEQEITYKAYIFLTNHQEKKVHPLVITKQPNKKTKEKGVISHVIDMGWVDNLEEFAFQLDAVIKEVKSKEP
ncbi:MAG TPA: hypothetical protein VK712_03590 [Verrucomicrobiae bacterium]|jgi:hypothetical protein|nr:hypothetical protein [Verrucomicrobiae bacterium]